MAHRLFLGRSARRIRRCSWLLAAFVWLGHGGTVEAQISRVKDINTATNQSGAPAFLANLNGTIYFNADDGLVGRELWKTDGTTAGTVLVKDIAPGSNNGPLYLTNVGGTLFFLANDSSSGYELWRSDGTAAGTVLVKDLYPGINSAFNVTLSVSPFVTAGGKLFLLADDGAGSSGLWRSDGTAAGTFFLKTLSGPLYTVHPTDVNGTLFFMETNATANGGTLWKSDGTVAGTLPVKSGVWIQRGSGCSACEKLMLKVNNTLFFAANDGVHGQEELFKSDGTAAGTVLVKDVFPGPTSSFPSYLTNLNGTLFFVADNGPNGTELWKSDGTEAGTVIVKELAAGTSSFFPRDLIAVNGVLYFTAEEPGFNRQLWRSDGTAAGTFKLVGTPDRLFEVNGTLYFNNGPNSLWKSDGTVAGTVAVANINVGTSSGATSDAVPSVAIAPAGMLFSGSCPFGTGCDNTYELWLLSASALAPALSIGDASVTEGNSGVNQALFNVSLFPASSQPVTLGYASSDGSAAAGEDYQSVSGSLTFAPGETSKRISVVVTGDANVEGDESFLLNLSAATNAVLARPQGYGQILDDDASSSLPRVSVDDRAIAEGSAINAAFRVFLSAPSTQTVTLKYATADGSATAPSDYASTSGTLSFSPGRTQHSVFVSVASDPIAEGPEAFYVNLSSPTDALLGDAQATGTIGDPPSAAKIAMYRSYNKGTDYHFFTTDLSSKNFAVNVLGFQDESTPVPFYVWNTQQSGTTPLFRMYNPNLGRHFYTASGGSRDFIISIGGVYEKEEGFVFPLSTGPVPSGATELFLLYNNNSGTHLFTADANQKNAILNLFPGIWVQHTSVGYVFTSP